MKTQHIAGPKKNPMSAQTNTHTQKTTQLEHNPIRLSLKIWWNVRFPQFGAQRTGFLIKFQSYLHLIPANLSRWARLLASPSNFIRPWAGRMVQTHILKGFCTKKSTCVIDNRHIIGPLEIRCVAFGLEVDCENTMPKSPHRPALTGRVGLKWAKLRKRYIIFLVKHCGW